MACKQMAANMLSIIAHMSQASALRNLSNKLLRCILKLHPWWHLIIQRIF